MTVTLQNVDFNFLEVLKSLVKLNTNVKLYQSEVSQNEETDFQSAITKWRFDSKELFENEEDAEFMQHAFDNIKSSEIYEAKEIW